MDSSTSQDPEKSKGKNSQSPVSYSSHSRTRLPPADLRPIRRRFPDATNSSPSVTPSFRHRPPPSPMEGTSEEELRRRRTERHWLQIFERRRRSEALAQRNSPMALRRGGHEAAIRRAMVVLVWLPDEDTGASAEASGSLVFAALMRGNLLHLILCVLVRYLVGSRWSLL